MAKVEAPNKDYSGPGPGGAVFENGIAETDDDAALNYYRGAGYRVSGKVENPIEPVEHPDPREVVGAFVGTRLRDAAVDPEPTDFLAPINAGKDNPHGSTVVSPEIHASGPSGIRPGDVFVEDVAKQEEREAEFATARLIDGKSAADANAGEVPNLDQRGDLGLSDPGSAEAGKVGASEESETDPEPPPAAKKATAKRAAAKKS